MITFHPNQRRHSIKQLNPEDSMSSELILTYDIGTTGNKCTIFNINGSMLRSVTVPYNTIYLKPGWSEQKSRRFLDKCNNWNKGIARRWLYKYPLTYQ